MRTRINKGMVTAFLTIVTTAIFFMNSNAQTPAAPVTPPGSTAPPTSVPALTPAPTPLPGQPAPLPGSTTPPGQTNKVNTTPNGSAPTTTPNPNSAYPNGGVDSSRVQFVPSQNYLQPAEPPQASPVTPADTGSYHPH